MLLCENKNHVIEEWAGRISNNCFLNFNFSKYIFKIVLFKIIPIKDRTRTVLLKEKLMKFLTQYFSFSKFILKSLG